MKFNYTKFARAVANAWIGEKGAWKSRMKQPLSILPNCSTCSNKMTSTHYLAVVEEFL